MTSYLFPSCSFALDRLIELEKLVGKDRLVVDVSCRKREGSWIVAMNRWQDMTDMKVNKGWCLMEAVSWKFPSHKVAHTSCLSLLCTKRDAGHACELLQVRSSQWTKVRITQG